MVGQPFPYLLTSLNNMDIKQLISDLGFPIVISLIFIFQIDSKLDEILKEIREIKNKD